MQHCHRTWSPSSVTPRTIGAPALAGRLPPGAPAPSPLLSRAGLINRQGPFPEAGPLKSINGRTGRAGVWHGDEAKAARPAGLPIRGEVDALDVAIASKSWRSSDSVAVYARLPTKISIVMPSQVGEWWAAYVQTASISLSMLHFWRYRAQCNEPGNTYCRRGQAPTNATPAGSSSDSSSFRPAR